MVFDHDSLISLYFNSDDALEQKHLDQLSEWIRQSPDNAQRFARAAFLNQAIHESVVRDNAIRKGFLCQEEPGVQDDLFWQTLAEEEKSAPRTEIPQANPPRELIQKVVYSPREKRRISQFQLLPLVIGAAAVLFIMLFVKFVPEKQYKVDVATLVDQVNAVWAQSDTAMQTGSRLWSNEGPRHLQKGIVKFRYDDGVEVLIEGPAVFEVRRSEVFLEYGRLYSHVAQTGLGFAVRTPTSNFIDMGTEFGVHADINGSSELHVTKGKVQLFAGKKGASKTSHMVAESKAVRYNANSDQVDTISFEKNAFVRQMDSKTGTIWRGQEKINLADMVGGGNGFGGGTINTGIDTTTGKTLTRLLDYVPFEGNAGYKTADNNLFIDGVFIPGATGGKSTLTSDGSCSATFPHASGRLWGYIFNGAFHQGTTSARSPLQLEGVVFGTPENPAITVHSNQGITFDLSEIRKSMPWLSITSFRSLAGISQTVRTLLEKNPDTPAEMKKGFAADRSKVEFWVFLDGKQVYRQEMSSNDPAAAMEIPIAAGDRFLTLAVTESDDGVDYDWALFGRPELTFETADE